MNTLILWGLVSCGFLFALLVYFLFMVYRAHKETRQAPRTPMYECPKHGWFPEKYVYNLTGLTEEPIQQCPMCMEEKIRGAK